MNDSKFCLKCRFHLFEVLKFLSEDLNGDIHSRLDFLLNHYEKFIP